MSDVGLDFHFASLDERKESFRNMHETWAWAPTVAEDIELRLASPQYRRARSCVGCLEGRVVVSLACYPMRYALDGKETAGIAIGAVFTVPEYRRRGFAARLMDWAEGVAKEEGATLSVLFSDIRPSYYERLGYVLCPSWEISGVLAGSTDAECVELDPAAEVGALRTLHDAYHGNLGLTVWRDDDYWQFLLRKSAENQFYWVNAPGRERLGYVLVGNYRGRLLVRDFALQDHNEETFSLLCAATARLLGERQADNIGGWLPALSVARRHFELTPRKAELSMVKSLVPEVELSPGALEDVQYFREIDHV